MSPVGFDFRTQPPPPSSQLLGWFDWALIYDLTCAVSNPYVLWRNSLDKEDVDCEANPQILTTVAAAQYSGK